MSDRENEEESPFEDTGDDLQVLPDKVGKQRRVAFSDDVAGLAHKHVLSPEEAKSMSSRRARRPVGLEDSLQLLDDLTRRPVDPLFEDATLLNGRKQSKTSKIVTKATTFIICVVVGIASFSIIQELNKDTRKKVREELAQQVTSALGSSETLTKDVEGLKTQVDDLFDQLNGTEKDTTKTNDSLVNGTTKITGPGVEVSLANPRAADTAQGANTRDTTASRIKLVTDVDLQRLVALLWSGGAEGISVNGVRLGVQSSVRAAGDAILVGVTPIQNPYTISAIGDHDALAAALTTPSAQQFIGTLGEQGIYPRTVNKSEVTLEAAGQPDVSDARKEE